jgi:hypothetical protein
VVFIQLEGMSMYSEEVLQEAVNENGFNTKTDLWQEVSPNEEKVSENKQKKHDWKDEDLDLVALRCRD